MEPSSLFEITRRNPSVNASAKYASDAVRGFALGAHGADPESFAPAQHNNFIGHLTRRVVTGGLSIVDRVFGVTSDTPVGVEAPFTTGQEVSVEKAHEIECEGSDYLVLSGTGAISNATPVPSNLSFKDGKLRLTQAGELTHYLLTANNLTPNTAGNLRLRAEKV
jgi:hypothetical protein